MLNIGDTLLRDFDNDARRGSANDRTGIDPAGTPGFAAIFFVNASNLFESAPSVPSVQVLEFLARLHAYRDLLKVSAFTKGYHT